MSVMSTKDISQRIRTAHFYSPIAVFIKRDKGKPDFFNAVFANTVFVQRNIRAKEETLMGIFWGMAGQERWEFLVEGRT